MLEHPTMYIYVAPRSSECTTESNEIFQLNFHKFMENIFGSRMAMVLGAVGVGIMKYLKKTRMGRKVFFLFFPQISEGKFRVNKLFIQSLETLEYVVVVL
jgi:hypothetical protein